MRITQNDLRTHVYQLVNKEQPALKHFLMHQYTSFGLRSYYEYDTQQIGCKARPWMIVNSKHRSIKESLYLIYILLRNQYIITTKIHLYSQLTEFFRDHSQMFNACILYCEIAPGHRRQPNERSHFDHIR